MIKIDTEIDFLWRKYKLVNDDLFIKIIYAYVSISIICLFLSALDMLGYFDLHITTSLIISIGIIPLAIYLYTIRMVIYKTKIRNLLSKEDLGYHSLNVHMYISLLFCYSQKKYYGFSSQYDCITSFRSYNLDQFTYLKIIDIISSLIQNNYNIQMQTKYSPRTNKLLCTFLMSNPSNNTDDIRLDFLDFLIAYGGTEIIKNKTYQLCKNSLEMNDIKFKEKFLYLDNSVAYKTTR